MSRLPETPRPPGVRIVHAIRGTVIPGAALLVALVLAAPVAAAGADEPADEAERLVTELSAEDGAQRDRAQARLIELGEPALPVLNRLLAEGGDPEAQARAEDAIKQIQAANPNTPTLVTVHLTGTPQEAFAELGRQAGVELGVWPPWMFKTVKSSRVTVNLDREPFWSAMRTLCELSGGVSVDRAGDLEQIILTGRDGWGRRPASSDGPFLMTVNSVSR